MIRFFAKLSDLFLRNRADSELLREVTSHLAMLEDDFRARGMSEQEARYAARRAYGSSDQAKELARDERGFVWLEQLLQDLRHATRGLLRSPNFALVCVLTLALGIGMNASIFTLVHSVLLKKLPGPDADRTVQVRGSIDQFKTNGFSYAAYAELSRQADVFDGIVGFNPRTAILEDDGTSTKVLTQMVTGDFFRFFHGKPALGRLLTDEDDRVEGASPVIVLSHSAWQSQFRGDPSIVGRQVKIDGVPVTIVGVASHDFVGADLQGRYDLWMPTSMHVQLLRTSRTNPNWVWLTIMGKLKRGINVPQASERLQAISKAIESALPAERANKGQSYLVVDASRGYDAWRTGLRDPLMVLAATVGLVLLLACANLANLFLARAADRHHEHCVRLSLGISRSRLLRQMLLESTLLSLVGGVIALGLSYLLTGYLLSIFNTSSGNQELHVRPDGWVLLFTFGTCALTSLLAGLYPAWRTSRTDAGPGLKGSSPMGARYGFARRSLIVVQVTVAIVLVFAASLFTRSLNNLKLDPLGYDVKGLLSISVDQRGAARTKKPVPGAPALIELANRVKTLPGVESVSWADPGLFSGRAIVSSLDLHQPATNPKVAGSVNILFAGAEYFSTVGIPVLRGREIRATDHAGAPLVSVVNQRLAETLWAGQDPIGMHFDMDDLKDVEVVGIAANSKYRDVREQAAPAAFFSFLQMPGHGGFLTVRYKDSAGQLSSEIRKLLPQVAPEYQISEMATLEMLRDDLISRDRLLAFLSTLFGVLALLLAVVGVYGLISYSVSRRTREIGIRMSIGAQRGDVLRLFLVEAAVLLGVSLLIGLPAALALGRSLPKLLYNVSASDPIGLVATVLLLGLGCLISACIPSMRATQIDPTRALRYD